MENKNIFDHDLTNEEQKREQNLKLKLPLQLKLQFQKNITNNNLSPFPLVIILNIENCSVYDPKQNFPEIHHDDIQQKLNQGYQLFLNKETIHFIENNKTGICINNQVSNATASTWRYNQIVNKFKLEEKHKLNNMIEERKNRINLMILNQKKFNFYQERCQLENLINQKQRELNILAEKEQSEFNTVIEQENKNFGDAVNIIIKNFRNITQQEEDDISDQILVNFQNVINEQKLQFKKLYDDKDYLIAKLSDNNAKINLLNVAGTVPICG
jgi:hypothetical protein